MSKKVLIVDDNELVRKSLGAMLTNVEVSALTAANGKDGLKLALEQHPDLVITDVHMPEMSGHDMIEKIRADEWGKKVPIIIMTVDDDADSINKALEEGVTVYLSKTTSDPAAIAEQIKTALG
jgi:CheY-like chemotaxis protein